MKKLANVEIYEYTTMTDIIVEDGVCRGIYAKDQNGQELEIYADNTIWASGGIGGRYQHSTNFPHLTGDALDISEKHGIRLEHLDYVQIHPTTLYSTKPGRRFLISESVRGEGAILLDKNKERFVNELLPRDVVTEEIRRQMKKDGTDHVWLSMERIDKDTILKHFPNIYHHCLEEGYDVTKECIPVVPAQHYFMGGVWVDSDSKTSMDHLLLWERQAVTECMEQTVWQAIRCWRVWCLRSVRQRKLEENRYEYNYNDTSGRSSDPGGFKRRYFQ